jgi:Icc-related predicted phosphoesterase
VKIVCTSDFHGRFPDDGEMPPGDVLVFAGDISLSLGMTRHAHSIEDALAPFDDWLTRQQLSYNLIVGIAGNHDRLLEEQPEVGKQLNWDYLCDSGMVYDGVKFWGAPWSNKFFDWSFMGNEAQLAERWALIPHDTDVLITHGPAYGVNDLAQGRTHVGSKSLREHIIEARPLLHVSGHIHEGRGIDLIGRTVCINPSYVDGGYRPGGAPIVCDLDVLSPQAQIA